MSEKYETGKSPGKRILDTPTVPPGDLIYTPPEGLTGAEVARRTAAGQSNRQTVDPGKSVPRIVADNLFTLFNLLNFALAFCLALVGSWRNMLFLGVVFSNTLVGTVQELRARAMLNKLQLLEVRDVRVIRDGQEQKCRPEELVLGDLAMIHAGDQIPADAVITEGVCAADESLLTGESEPVTHRPGDLLLSGSFLTEGQVTAQLIAVGDNSYAARLMKEAKQITRPRSELMSELNKLVSLVSKLVVPIGILLLLQQVLMQKAEIRDAVPKAVAAMIGMIPEGLILLTSVALMAGVVKLGRRKTLVQELFGIETLARVDLLCTDKTGTLTTGEMTLDHVIPLEASEQEFRSRAVDFVSAFEADSGTLRVIAEAFGTEGRKADDVLPFSSARKKSAASFSDGTTLILGAPSFVWDEVPPEAIRATEEGFRVLLLAEAKGCIENDQIPPVTRLLGLFLLRETLRLSAKDTIQWFQREGVSVRIMSGDDPRTVAAIGRTLELENCDKIVDCARLNDEELRASARDGVIFGRLTPDRKRILVDAFKEAGHHVAMTGDGVNDIPSLKAADCSIAMGGGAEATEHAAQLVLLNNDFNSLPEVVREGRRVIGNITRTSSLFLQKNLYSFALSVLNLLIGLFLPLQYPFQPIHLTLVSSWTVGIPAFFLALEPSSERAKGNFLKRIILKATPAALGVVCCALAAMILNYRGEPEGITSTLAVLSAGVIGLANLVLTCLPLSRLRLLICVAMSLSLSGIVSFFPGVFALHTTEMTAEHWMIFMGMTAIGLIILFLGTCCLRPVMKKLETA
ncbi:MAG: HAD-IC family P-type ATPase [Clostridia bacterium]|nr:HAD-IC family P-type ATPase [Clostridia bacterium]